MRRRRVWFMPSCLRRCRAYGPRGLSWIAVLLTLLGVASCNERTPRRAAVPPASTAPPRVVVDDQRARLAQYPCDSCHANIASPTAAAKQVKRHLDISPKHFAGAEQCRHCHNPSQVDQLRLLDGTTVPLNRVDRACGQCHSRQAEDWLTGAHGKAVGSWNQTRYRYTCTNCHDPHSPRLEPVLALPAPPRPKLGIPKVANHE